MHCAPAGARRHSTSRVGVLAAIQREQPSLRTQRWAALSQQSGIPQSFATVPHAQRSGRCWLRHLPGNGEVADPNAVRTSRVAGRRDAFTSACTVCLQPTTVLVHAWRQRHQDWCRRQALNRSAICGMKHQAATSLGSTMVLAAPPSCPPALCVCNALRTPELQVLKPVPKVGLRVPPDALHSLCAAGGQGQ